LDIKFRRELRTFTGKAMQSLKIRSESMRKSKSGGISAILRSHLAKLDLIDLLC
jgi:hypothetical protein